jgi:hypothetical protein
MDIEMLKSLKGKHISTIIQGTPHPSSGHLIEVGSDYIVLQQDSGNKIIITTNQIASILVASERTKNDKAVFNTK